MRAVRFLTLALLLVLGFAGKASAQTYSNATGVFTDVGVGVVPAGTQQNPQDELPPGSLPPGLPRFGPDLYRGTLTVLRNGDGTYSVDYNGETADRAKLHVVALFASDWAGIKRGTFPVGTSIENNVIKGIDGANLLSANINGVGTVDGAFQRVIAKFTGDGSTFPPTLSQFKVLKAPGFLR
jgi:hypothetical protein